MLTSRNTTSSSNIFPERLTPQRMNCRAHRTRIKGPMITGIKPSSNQNSLSIKPQNKSMTHKRKIPLYRITTKEGTLPFQQIAMDLITGLLQQHGYNAILTIVDHGCSRAAIFL